MWKYQHRNAQMFRNQGLGMWGWNSIFFVPTVLAEKISSGEVSTNGKCLKRRCICNGSKSLKKCWRSRPMLIKEVIKRLFAIHSPKISAAGRKHRGFSISWMRHRRGASLLSQNRAVVRGKTFKILPRCRRVAGQQPIHQNTWTSRF